MLEFVLNLFFPQVCGICGKLDKNWLCDNCKKVILEKQKTEFIKVYSQNYEELLYLFLYKDIRNEILKYKFYDSAYLSNMFVNIILENRQILSKIKEFDIIIPVPMAKRKKANRGYNQTELIAKKLANQINMEYNSKCLIKIINNRTQSSLNEKERLENIKNVFSIADSKIIFGKKVILFDDIVTTGATVNECSRLLKNAGASEIIVFALAKD